MTMENIGADPWPLRVISEGWQALRNKAHNALTYFRPDEKDTIAQAQNWSVNAADLVDEGDALELHLELPGMEKADLDVEIHGRTLIVGGEKQMTSTRRDGAFLMTERAFGRFRRTFPLPADVKPEAVTASYKKGVLYIRLPKTTPENRRKVAISAH